GCRRRDGRGVRRRGGRGAHEGAADDGAGGGGAHAGALRQQRVGNLDGTGRRARRRPQRAAARAGRPALRRMVRAVRLSRLFSVALAAMVCLAGPASAEVFVRWETRPVPPRDALGVAALVVPAADAGLAQEVRAAGYRVILETAAEALDAIPRGGEVAGVFVRGRIDAARLDALRAALGAGAAV